MKLDNLLGTLAIVGLLSACSSDHGRNADPLFDEGSADGSGAPSNEPSGDQGESRPPANDDAGASKHDANPADHDDAQQDGEASEGGAAPGSDGAHEIEDHAGDANADEPGRGGGGVPASGGSGGAPASAGGGSNPGTGGSGTNLGTGGSGGSSGAGGSSATPITGGSGGVAGSPGASGTAGSGGSSIAGGAGAGGTTGGGGSDGVAGRAGGGGEAGEDDDHELDPEFLFTKETFGGNGRTCATCHSATTGTISPDQVEALYASDPSDPLFRSVDSDDGVGNDYTQLRGRATFRVTIDLPSGVHLASDSSATSITFRRGVPSTINTPALDPVLMWDGRQPDLTSQALSAALGHAQATVTPTPEQLKLITEFEQGPSFFSNDLLRAYDQGGTTPSWPPGVTEAEQRGRRWFAQDAAAPRFNICGMCHGGPMLNETQANSGLPVGKHFQTVNVSEFNTLGNPTHQLTFPDPNHPGQTVTVVTPDPGRALITGDVRDVNFFKIPTLWGVKNTAPYFHDNSAKTLEQLVDHYERHLATFLPRNRSYPSPHVPTAQDKADIVAYLKLL